MTFFDLITPVPSHFMILTLFPTVVHSYSGTMAPPRTIWTQIERQTSTATHRRSLDEVSVNDELMLLPLPPCLPPLHSQLRYTSTLWHWSIDVRYIADNRMSSHVTSYISHTPVTSCDVIAWSDVTATSSASRATLMQYRLFVQLGLSSTCHRRFRFFCMHTVCV